MDDKALGKILVDLATVNHQLLKEGMLKQMNGDTLSYTAVKVAAMKSTLIEFKVHAHQDMLDKEVEMGRQKAIAYKKALKETNATAAKDGKYDDEDFVKAIREYNDAKVLYEKLRSITADAHDVIDAIKSRVIDLQGARKDERVR